MKTACLVITLALMVMTVASSPSWPLRRTRKVYEDPSPCDQTCWEVCCAGDCKIDADLEDLCSVECGCRKRTLQDPNPCDQACYDGCCEGECAAGSETEDICSSECGCPKRTLQDPNPCDQACYDGCCEGECTAGSVVENVCSSECGCPKRTLQDPNPCDQGCHDDCCTTDSGEYECTAGSNQKDTCDQECGCRKRTLQGMMAKRRRTFFEDPSPCDQGCHDDCCTTDSGEYECTAGSNRKDICDQECGCRKRTLQALKAKRGDEEYPTDAAYHHVSAAECAACKKSECPAGVSDVVCNEICGC